MDEKQRFAIICMIVEKLNRHDSWCGETHIQKAAYLAEAFFKIPLRYNFILYRYGPYSSRLSYDLVGMELDNYLIRKVTSPGATYNLSLPEEVISLPGKQKKQLDFIATAFGKKGVADLERLSTAFWVIENYQDKSMKEQAKILSSIKMHVPLDKAFSELEKMKEIITAGEELQ